MGGSMMLLTGLKAYLVEDGLQHGPGDEVCGGGGGVGPEAGDGRVQPLAALGVRVGGGT